MTDTQTLDEAAVSAYLTQNLPGFEGPMEVTKFQGGQSNPTFMLKTPAHSYVLRRKPPGVLLKSAHAVDREFRVQKALEGSDVPVSKMHLLCEDDSVIGSMFYIMDHVQGRNFNEPAMPDLTKADRSKVISEMNRVLAALHSVDIDAVGLSDYGPEGNYFERQVGRWSKQYRASETQSIPAMDQLMDALVGERPADDGQRTQRVQIVVPYWIGNYPPSAIPLPIWRLSSCSGNCPQVPKDVAWVGWIARHLACQAMKNLSRNIARGAGSAVSTTLDTILGSPFSAWRRLFRVC